MNTPAPPPPGEYQLLTAPGPAAIAIIRVRGAACETFLREHLRPATKTDIALWQIGRVSRAELHDLAGAPLDDILVSVHTPGPKWDVRLHLHGSRGVLQACRELLHTRGFVQRCENLSGLWQSESTIEAEAFVRIPEMPTLRGAQWLLRQSRHLPDRLRTLAEEPDQPAALEEIRRIIARGVVLERFTRAVRIALIGPPNAGKSTLFNALADRRVSIVSNIPGTTRDWLETPSEIAGFPVTWLDTAGLGCNHDVLGNEAVRRTHRLIETADAVLFVLDAGPTAAPARASFLSEYSNLDPICIAMNKQDLHDACDDPTQMLPERWHYRAVPISAARSSGLELLSETVLKELGYAELDLESPAVFTQRQRDRLCAALAGGRNRFRELTLACGWE